MSRFVALTIATWCGSGRIPAFWGLPLMPGTWGSIFAVPLCIAALSVAWNIKVDDLTPVANYALGCFVVFMAGIWAVPTAEYELGKMKDGYGEEVGHDQGQIVIDEVVGMMVSCAPLLWMGYHAPASIIALVTADLLFALALFRLADIFKPWPLKCFDRMGGAFGVMFDDVVAGAYAAFGVGAFNWAAERILARFGL